MIPTEEQLTAMESTAPMLVAEVRRLRAEIVVIRDERETAQRGCTTLSGQLNEGGMRLLRVTATLDRLKGACMASVRAAGGTIESTSSTPTPTGDDVAAAVTVLIAQLHARAKGVTS